MKPNPSHASASARPVPEVNRIAARHLRFGWWSLLAFLALGTALEALHGFKAALYLNVSNEIRRLMWTLAHAHGTLLALVNIAFAITVPLLPDWAEARRHLASRSLIAASVLLPAGFFLGGLVLYGGDPGLGIVLVPLGAILLFISIYQTARAASSKLP